jgi:hypothetical protein
MHSPLDNPLIIPLGLVNPSPVPEPLSLTWNPSFALWCNSRPLWSQVACVLTYPPPFLPILFSLSRMVPHFKYVPSYDDITTSASHSPIQFSCSVPCCALCYCNHSSLLSTLSRIFESTCICSVVYSGKYPLPLRRGSR